MSSRPAGKAPKPRPALFRALGRLDPPESIEVGGQRWPRVRTIKHDSWAATALYQCGDRLIVCKFNRQQHICFFPMTWLGRLLARREQKMLSLLQGIRGAPTAALAVRIAGKAARHAVAREYIPGHPLGKHEAVGDEFFAELKELLQRVHARNVAYVDLHKRENIIVGNDGRPHLIDFQISFVLPRRWPANNVLTRALLGMLQQSDDYHLEKHYARCRPDLCGRSFWNVRENPPWWIGAHRQIAIPLRTARRFLLMICGIRAAGGRAESEQFVEEAHRLAKETAL